MSQTLNKSPRVLELMKGIKAAVIQFSETNTPILEELNKLSGGTFRIEIVVLLGADASHGDLVKALRILLAARDCLAPDGSPEIPEHISASFDIGLEDAQFISALELPK